MGREVGGGKLVTAVGSGGVFQPKSQQTTKSAKKKKKRNKIIDNPGLHVGYLFPHAY